MQAGLSALKSSQSYEEGSSKEDPLRLQVLGANRKVNQCNVICPLHLLTCMWYLFAELPHPSPGAAMGKTCTQQIDMRNNA